MTNHKKFKLEEKYLQKASGYAEAFKFFLTTVWVLTDFSLSKIGQLLFELAKGITSKILKYSVLGQTQAQDYVNFVNKNL